MIQSWAALCDPKSPICSVTEPGLAASTHQVPSLRSLGRRVRSGSKSAIPPNMRRLAKAASSFRGRLIQTDPLPRRMPRNSFGPEINLRFRVARSSSVADLSPSLLISRLAISAALGAPLLRARGAEGSAMRARSSRRRIASGRESPGSWSAIQPSRTCISLG
jgi:hypothetical protein